MSSFIRIILGFLIASAAWGLMADGVAQLIVAFFGIGLMASGIDS